MVFALAHCALFGVKCCCEPYKPVGSRLAIVTFAYGSAFGVDGAVELALLVGPALAPVPAPELVFLLALGEGDGAAGAFAEADGLAPSDAIVEALATGAETSVTLRVDKRVAAADAECVFFASTPAAAAPAPPAEEPKAPYEAAAAVPVGTTIAAVTTAAKAVGLVLGLRCAPMK